MTQVSTLTTCKRSRNHEFKVADANRRLRLPAETATDHARNANDGSKTSTGRNPTANEAAVPRMQVHAHAMIVGI